VDWGWTDSFTHRFLTQPSPACFSCACPSWPRLASQQIHSEYTQHGDSFEDHSGQMGDSEDGSEGRGDLDDFVPEWAGEPDDHEHHQSGVDDGLTESPGR
jgi:hypothetical protein